MLCLNIRLNGLRVNPFLTARPSALSNQQMPGRPRVAALPTAGPSRTHAAWLTGWARGRASQIPDHAHRQAERMTGGESALGSCFGSVGCLQQGIRDNLG